jgi:hypothetical protein
MLLTARGHTRAHFLSSARFGMSCLMALELMQMAVERAQNKSKHHVLVTGLEEEKASNSAI